MARQSASHSFPVRQVGAYVVLVVFLSYVLIAGLLSSETEKVLSGSLQGLNTDSEYGPYVYLTTLRNDQLKFESPGRRIIVVGDIHGMNSSLSELLGKLRYTPTTDILIHTGDIVAKSTLQGSLATLSFMSSYNITGVRGNHDQRALEWRGWFERAWSKKGGQEWIEKVEKASGKKKDLKKLLKTAKGWQKVPKDWEVMGDHYLIAKEMTKKQHDYLLALPLVLHIPHLHTFVVHAGVLPIDPRLSPTSVRQPLAHAPKAPESLDVDLDKDTDTWSANKNLTILRSTQERAILSDVAQNREPWNLLNIRSVKRDSSVTNDGQVGTPWASIWNAIIKHCDGFIHDLDIDDEDDSDDKDDEDHGEEEDDLFEDLKSLKLPCYPSTVVYGHAASRGLDIKRWSKGLDSGCVYGRRLTALVLSSRQLQGSEDEDGDMVDSSRIKFGEQPSKIAARLVRVKCPQSDDT